MLSETASWQTDYIRFQNCVMEFGQCRLLLLPSWLEHTRRPWYPNLAREWAQGSVWRHFDFVFFLHLFLLSVFRVPSPRFDRIIISISHNFPYSLSETTNLGRPSPCSNKTSFGQSWSCDLFWSIGRSHKLHFGQI